MTARLLERSKPALLQAPVARPLPAEDAGYGALQPLTWLRDQLAAAAAGLRPKSWNEPPVFFFDRRRQADLEAARPTPASDPFAEVSSAITSLLDDLFASVEVRRVARAIDGLRAAAEALAPACPAAKDLAELLAVPDDEVVLVLDPGRQTGFRLSVRGVVDVGQFQVLLADAVAAVPPVAERFVAACRDVHPATAAGVPMVVRSPFQLYLPAALQCDGSLPAGLGGAQHWLWPAMPLASVPRLDGERVVLAGPPTFASTWEVSRRFPALAADVKLIEALSPQRVADRLAHPGARVAAAEHQPASAVSNAA